MARLPPAGDRPRGVLRVTAGFVAFSWGAGIGQFGGLGEPARGDGDGVGVGGAIRIGRRES